MNASLRRIAKSVIRDYPDVARAIRDEFDEQELEEVLSRDARRRELPMELRSIPGLVVRSKHEGDL